MNRTTTRGFRVAFFHADMDEPQDDEKAQDQPRPTYPQRPAYFAHKFVRKLSKSAAAMEIGPEACWLLTVIAFQEDSCRYKRAVMFWDQGLAALVGLGSERTLSRCREKAVEAGWLHYEAGRRRVPGRYWVLIPEHAEVFDDSPIGVDESSFLGTRAEKPPSNRRESVSAAAEQLTEQPPTDCRTFIPVPSPNPIPEEKTHTQAEQQNWKDIPSGTVLKPPPETAADRVETQSDPSWTPAELEEAKSIFLTMWNDNPICVKSSFIPEIPLREFIRLWFDPQLRPLIPKAISRLQTCYWKTRRITIKKFFQPQVIEDICNGGYDIYDGNPGGSSHAKGHGRGSRETPLHLRIGGADIQPREGDPF